MKTKLFWLLGLSLLIIRCDREPSVTPSINFVGSTDCKSLGLKSINDQSSDKDCIQYRWVTGDSLIIKHINAAFNCCPLGFITELKVSGDTLIVTEKENSSMCDCSCLFDLNYNLAGITRDTWWIRIDEQYVQQPGAEKILFKAEFSKVPEGEFCVTRTGYPWGTK